MRKRIKSLTVAVAALAALALGGGALATASSSPSTSPPEKVSATDPGPAVQQGDQTTPDAAVAGKKHAKKAAEPQSASDPAGTNDTTSPDTGSPASESASKTGPSDGPGGFADTNPTADTQQQGEH